MFLASKYCVLARNEHGEPLLKRIIDNEKFGDAIRNLAATAIENIEKFYNSDAAMEIETNEEADWLSDFQSIDMHLIIKFKWRFMVNNAFDTVRVCLIECFPFS